MCVVFYNNNTPLSQSSSFSTNRWYFMMPISNGITTETGWLFCRNSTTSL